MELLEPGAQGGASDERPEAGSALEAAPASDGAVEHTRAVDLLRPGGGEGGRAARGLVLAGQRVEADLHRHRHTLADHDRLPGAERGQGADQPVGAVGEGVLDVGLVALVAEAEREDRAALREAARGKARRAAG